MYTDEDLTNAVEKDIFSQDAVDNFRTFIAEHRDTSLVDEENFRLLTGFNDVFVVIASGLLLASIAWLGATFNAFVGAILFAATSWGLAEFFVLKRRMALPAIALLLTFLGGVFAAPIVLQDNPTEWNFIASGILTAIAARMHWQRFMVPITVAAGTVAGLVCLFGVLVSVFPDIKLYYLQFLFMAGIACFGLAMFWDASDRERKTRYSDVAFWLHLVSAPLIVHPVFSTLGILQGVESLTSSLIVVGLYVLLALISIAVDRRAIMVSALVYVVYAFSGLLETYGMVSYSFAITGVCIGSTLLLLSAFWHNSREKVLKLVPGSIQGYLPLVKA